MNQFIIDSIIKGIFETLQMTLFSSVFAYIIGLPLGILLYTTSKGRLYENRAVNAVVGAIVNLSRSLPFLILLVLADLAFSTAVQNKIYSRCVYRYQGVNCSTYDRYNTNCCENG